MSPLTKKHVVVHTATVDVKVLRLDKKQMTLSVFRQLPTKQIISSTFARFSGTPWGRVHYMWSGESDWATYWVVWEQEGVLYRSPCIYRSNLRGITTETWLHGSGRKTKNTVDVCSLFFCEITHSCKFITYKQLVSLREYGRCQGVTTEDASYVLSVVNLLEVLESLDQLFISV